MVSTELGACEWFVWDLRRSNLLDRGRLDQIVGEFLAKNPRAEPPALSDFLVRQNILTQFQAERLLQGKTQGFVLGPFTLMDALGAGSMGTVYKAQSKTDNNWYAVKVLPRRSMWNVRIARRKVRSFEQCRHPAVVPFVDVGTAGGMHYLAWPLVEGETLDKVVQQQGRLPTPLAARIALQIAEGLDVCHQQGLIHGLLKPSNIMIGADNQVFILDFGIGCLLAETEGESLVDTMSTANSVTSGLDCASTESIMDPTNLTPAGDQYSLGCLLYYLLAGQFPFPDGNAAEKMMAHQFKQPKPLQELNADVPAPLLEIVARLMQKAPDSRYPDAAAAIAALKPLAGGGGDAPRPVLTKPAAEPTPRAAAPKPTVKPTVVPAVAQTPKVSPAAKPAPASKSPAPSTPTPRPQPIGTLPTRDAIRGTPKAAAAVTSPAPALPEAVLIDPKKRVIPGGVTDEEASAPSPEDQLGPIGIAFSALVACALVYFLAVLFRVF